MILVSGFFYAGFPFDQLCPEESTVDDSYLGTWEIQTVQSTLNENQAWWLGYWRTDDDAEHTITVVVGEGEPTFRVCPHSFLRGFWEDEDAFFSEDQQLLVTIYGWASVVVMAGVVVWYLLQWLSRFRGLFHSSYKEVSRRELDSLPLAVLPLSI